METKLIQSSDNANFKNWKKLACSTRERRKQGRTLLDGIHLLQALYETGGKPDLIILDQAQQDKQEFQQYLQTVDCPKVVLTSALFREISRVETPSGIVGIYPVPVPAKHAQGFIVLLENIQDPGNLGSIIRTAAAAAVDGIYLSKGCAEAWSPKALRAGMGAHFNVPIYEKHDLIPLAIRSDRVLATSLSAQKSLYDTVLGGDIAFVFGNEGTGLTPELLKHINEHVLIPMPGKIESLNVAAAAAVCLFERVRQTKARP
ncbi:MAG: RNA methyltransferase [Gammaproteobacteria bacterium]|nr:RNA methyltransferase [Gammaproteobacteria bacterium]